MSAITVEQILADLNSQHEKTAAAQPPAPSAPSDLETHRQELDQALDQFTSETKTAGESSLESTDATAHLEKVAAEIEAAEAHAIVKEAELFAGAFFHSFLNHANQYAEAAGTKTAAAQQPQVSIEDQVKIAAARGAEDVTMLLQAVGQQQKTAADAENSPEAYVQGVSDTLEKVAEFCHSAFNMGYADIEAVVSQ